MFSAKIRKLFSYKFLLINSVAWFLLTWMILSSVVEMLSFFYFFVASLLYYGGLVGSALLGVIWLHENLRKKFFLFFWVSTGICSCILAAFLLPYATLLSVVISALILGVSVGINMPACLSFIGHYTKVEGRGRTSAIIFFAVQLITALLYAPLISLDMRMRFLILAMWRLSGVASIFLFNFEEKPFKEHKIFSFFSILSERSFILYFSSWFLFCLINFIEIPVIRRFLGPDLFSSHIISTFIISSISAYFGGILCDLKGRRTTSIIGFILLGIGYAALSLFAGTQLSIFIYTLLDGIAWGILYVVFIFVIWGDLSENKNRERYYLIGGMPFLFSGLIEVVVEPFVEFIPIYTSFSLASFCLFLAVLPLLYAPETLPEKIIRHRELKEYIEKAKRIREKYEKEKD